MSGSSAVAFAETEEGQVTVVTQHGAVIGTQLHGEEREVS